MRYTYDRKTLHFGGKVRNFMHSSMHYIKFSSLIQVQHLDWTTLKMLMLKWI